MKPLNINEVLEEEEDDGTKEGTLIPGDRNRTRHLPAEHWGEKANSAKIRLVKLHREAQVTYLYSQAQVSYRNLTVKLRLFNFTTMETN